MTDPRVQEISEAVGRIDAELDEVTRARIESKLFQRLEEEPAPRVSILATRRVMIAALAAAAAVAFGAAVMLRDRGAHPLAAPIALSPRLISGFDPSLTLSDAMLGAGIDRLFVPEGGVVSAELGARAYLTLIGRGELAVRPPDAIALFSGSLIVDADQTLTVFLEPGASDEAVVSVTRGIVEVQPANVRLLAGQRFSSKTGIGLSSEHAALHAAMTARGLLVVRSDPSGAEVRLHGESLGKTPIHAVIEVGHHELEIATRKVEADIRPNAVSVVQVALVLAEPVPVPVPVPVPDPERTPAKKKTVVPIETAEQMYQRAEQAMAASNEASATEILRALVRQFPDDALANTALFELARMSDRSGDRATAKTYLQELLARKSDGALAESAHHMLCELQIKESDPPAAIDCLAAFRRRFPSSTHDRAVLRALAGLAEQAAGCRAALPWLEELARTNPDDEAVQDLAERRRRCSE